MDDLLQALRATAEPTRLRIVAVLSRSELTVSELCRVLGQSQPRVSRHLRLLCDAGILERHPQGTSAYYRPAPRGAGAALRSAVVSLLPSDDLMTRRDIACLNEIREERAVSAAAYFEQVASSWDAMRRLHVADADVEAAMLELLRGRQVHDLLDIGTGTGRMLELFATHIEHGLGIDSSRQMIDLARSRLDQVGHDHCAVRLGDVYHLPVEAGSVDAAVLHHVLHFLDDPPSAIAEVARTLRPGGRLLIADFGPHNIQRLQTDYRHHWLGLSDSDVRLWCAEAGLGEVSLVSLDQTPTGSPGKLGSENATPRADDPGVGDPEERLTVHVWAADQRSDAPSLARMENAS